MSVQRSPTGSGLSAGRCGSFPELSTASPSSDSAQITFRNKRRLPCECGHMDTETSKTNSELAEMKKQMSGLQAQMQEMMSHLMTNNSIQLENFNKLCEDISIIKEQASSMKLATDHLAEEQKCIKIEISDLKNSNIRNEEKIATIESSLKEMPAPTSHNSIQTQENIVAELNERQIRCKNILISGVPEPTTNNIKDRQEQDRKAVCNIIKSICPDSAEPMKLFRLGKYYTDKKRLIKVIFTSQEQALQILRQKENLKDEGIKIFSDQTPQQQSYMKIVKEELDRRIKNGEPNLIIKYIKGIPKIVVPANSKNYQQ